MVAQPSIAARVERCGEPSPWWALGMGRYSTVAPTSMHGCGVSVARARSASVAWCISVTSVPSFVARGIDEGLRVSRLLSGSTDGEGPTVRQICTFYEDLGIAADQPVSPGRSARSTLAAP